MTEEDLGSWKGKPMMNPKGQIGRVISDVNGFFRVLTVRFPDGSQEVLRLNNIGGNSEEAKKWKWLCEHHGKKKWVLWGY